MRNSPLLPTICLVLALALGVHTAYLAGQSEGPLNELALGEIGVALTLAIYGAQGLISVLIEGQELRLGRVPPRLTDLLTVGILLLAFILFGIAVALAFGIADGWSREVIGALAGLGSIDLGLLLVFYKEAFIGDEARFDDRDDGVPW